MLWKAYARCIDGRAEADKRQAAKGFDGFWLRRMWGGAPIRFCEHQAEFSTDKDDGADPEYFGDPSDDEVSDHDPF